MDIALEEKYNFLGESLLRCRFCISCGSSLFTELHHFWRAKFRQITRPFTASKVSPQEKKRSNIIFVIFLCHNFSPVK